MTVCISTKFDTAVGGVYTDYRRLNGLGRQIAARHNYHSPITHTRPCSTKFDTPANNRIVLSLTKQVRSPCAKVRGRAAAPKQVAPRNSRFPRLRLSFSLFSLTGPHKGAARRRAGCAGGRQALADGTAVSR